MPANEWIRHVTSTICKATDSGQGWQWIRFIHKFTRIRRCPTTGPFTARCLPQAELASGLVRTFSCLCRMIWDEEYRVELLNNHPVISEPGSSSPPPPQNYLDMLLRRLQPPTQTADDTDNADNFVAFVEAPPTKLGKDTTPLGWWCDPTTRRRYPRLSRMAIAILSIPAQSTEPEQTFSGARRTC
jgi:hypothetical protein